MEDITEEFLMNNGFKKMKPTYKSTTVPTDSKINVNIIIQDYTISLIDESFIIRTIEKSWFKENIIFKKTKEIEYHLCEWYEGCSEYIRSYDPTKIQCFLLAYKLITGNDFKITKV